MKKIGIALMALLAPLMVFSQEPGQRWILSENKLTYKIVFPMHHPQGVSREGSGAGQCGTEGCEFVVSAPMKSFDSRNKKRDHDMLETMRAEKNPDVKVTARFPQFPGEGEKFKADLTVDMSGETATYAGVEFLLVMKSDDALQVQGTIPMLLEDFKVVRPSLMGVKVKNLCPVTVDATWTKQVPEQ